MDILWQTEVAQDPGDVAKALAGGVHFVMIGGMLAGHVEGGGELITTLC